MPAYSASPSNQPKTFQERAKELWALEEERATKFSKQFTPVQKIGERRKAELRVNEKLALEFDANGNPLPGGK